MTLVVADGLLVLAHRADRHLEGQGGVEHVHVQLAPHELRTVRLCKGHGGRTNDSTLRPSGSAAETHRYMTVNVKTRWVTQARQGKARQGKVITKGLALP